MPSAVRVVDHRPSAPISAMPCASTAAWPRHALTVTPFGVACEVFHPGAELEI